MPSILNNSINLPMKMTPTTLTSSPVHTVQAETKTTPVAGRLQKICAEETSNLKKAMSTPSIVEKIRLEDSSDNVFYDKNPDLSTEYDSVIKTM